MLITRIETFKSWLDRVVVCGIVIGSAVGLSVMADTPLWVVALLILSFLGTEAPQSPARSVLARIEPTPHYLASVASTQSSGAQATPFVFPIFAAVALTCTHIAYGLPPPAADGMLATGAACHLFVVGRTQPLALKS